MGNCVKKLAAELLSAAIAVTMISGPVSAYAAEPQETPAPQESDEVIPLEEDIEENTLLTLGGAYTLSGRTLTNVLVNTGTLKGTSELSTLKAAEGNPDQGPGETLPESEKETEKQTETATETEAVTELQSGAPQEPVTEEQTEAPKQTEATTEEQTGAPKQTEATTEKQTEESEKNETMTKAGGESESETEAGKHETGTGTGTTGESETGTTGESETGTADENKTGESETRTTGESETEAETSESETGTTDETGTGTTDESETGTTDESKTGETGIGTTDESETGTTDENETGETETETGETDESETETEIGETDESESESETEKSEESESETEKEYKTDFLFENEEVKITVTAKKEAHLPMDTELVAEKLAEDSNEYQEAKNAADAVSGADPEATHYSFYNLKLVSESEAISLEDGAVSVQIVFKNIEKDENSEQNVFHIEDTENGKVAQNITDTTATEGNNLISRSIDV